MATRDERMTMLSAKIAARMRAEFEADAAVDPANADLWRRYALFELDGSGGGGIEFVRSIYERALAACADDKCKMVRLYRTWAGMERKVGNVAGVRSVFERELQQFPEGPGVIPNMDGWRGLLKLEVDNGEVERACAVGERLLKVFPYDPHAYALYIKALAALGLHEHAKVIESRGYKELAALGPRHADSLGFFMNRYLTMLDKKQPTGWADITATSAIDFSKLNQLLKAPDSDAQVKSYLMSKTY